MVSAHMVGSGAYDTGTQLLSYLVSAGYQSCQVAHLLLLLGLAPWWVDLTLLGFCWLGHGGVCAIPGVPRIFLQSLGLRFLGTLLAGWWLLVWSCQKGMSLGSWSIGTDDPLWHLVCLSICMCGSTVLGLWICCWLGSFHNFVLEGLPVCVLW